MLAIKNQYGPAPKAFFVVPLVGGMFIDFTNSAIINCVHQPDRLIKQAFNSKRGAPNLGAPRFCV